MLAIVVGLLFTVAIALGIVVLVALPNLRQGSRILTPDGERAVQRAKQQARQTPLAAAGGTWHGLVALKRLIARLGRRIVRAWGPVSSRLHEALDRLEARDTAEVNGSDAEPSSAGTGRESGGPAAAPIRHAAGPSRPAPAEVPEAAEAGGPAGRRSGPKQDRFDVARIIGRSAVGRPRPAPAISGPIPEIGDDQSGPGDRTIDLRESDRSDRSERSDADQEAGSARRAR